MRALAVALVTLLAPLSAHAELPKEKTETWYEFLFHGKRVGFVYALDEPSTLEGRPVLHSQRRSVLVVKRASEVIRIESDTNSYSDPDGRPIRFNHVRTEGGAVRKLEGAREGDSFVVRHDVGGTLNEKRVPFGDDLRLAAALDLSFKRGLSVGKKLSGRAILEEDGDAAPFTMEVKGKEGDKFVVIGVVAGIETKDLVTAAGKTVRGVVERMGAEYVESTRDKALGAVEPTDIFGAAHLLSGTVLPQPTEKMDALTVHLTGRSGRAPRPVLDDRSRITSKAKAWVELEIKAERAPLKPTKLGAPVTDAEGKRLLAETPYEAVKDERLSAAAKRAIGDAADTWTAARRLNRFVYEHIKKKSLAQAFSTAIEALESREGDCTEHAVLMSALSRAIGIPTRFVTGLVYVGGEQGVFGYHAWVELRIGGEWVAMDPTFGQDLADVTHIKFSQGSSDPDGLRESGVVAAELFGDLDLAVVEYVEIGGKRTRP